MFQKDIFIDEAESIKSAFKKLDDTAEKVLLVVDNSRKLMGTLTDGDIRRYILKGKSLENTIEEIYNKKPLYLKQGTFSQDQAKKMFIENKVELFPVLDEEDKVVDCLIWNQLLSDDEVSAAKTTAINIPVVIMAGGKGTRLEPFNRVFPKLLIPIGDRPIVEIIIDEFKKQGVNEFYLMLNYKSQMIESYFNSIEKDYEIKYIKENSFLGTAGGLKVLEEEISDVFFVSNCDVIIKTNFEDVINFHKEQDALITSLSSIQYYKIPYGVIKFKEGGKVVDILEKPEYTLMINAGIYVLSRESLQFIPGNSPFDMTDLIKSLIKNNKKVVMYPVNEKKYIDVGQWEEYKKAIEKLQLFE